MCNRVTGDVIAFYAYCCTITSNKRVSGGIRELKHNNNHYAYNYIYLKCILWEYGFIAKSNYKYSKW